MIDKAYEYNLPNFTFSCAKYLANTRTKYYYNWLVYRHLKPLDYLASV